MKKLVVIFAAVLFSSMAIAQTNFSGSWKINSAKSKLGERSFGAGSLVIVQKDNNLSIESHMAFQDQEMTSTDKLTLDGKECVNAGMMDSQKKSVATWSEDKTTLKIVGKVDFQEQTMTTTETYKLDAGNLVIESSMDTPGGEMKETRVYDKQ